MQPLPTSFSPPVTHSIPMCTEVPGVLRKDDQPPVVQKTLTLDMIDQHYNEKEWTQVYTDGSAEEAVKNGGAGIFIKLTDGKLIPRAFPTGKFSSNYRAETMALLSAVQFFSKSSNPPPKIVFFTDCKSVLESLLNDHGEHEEIQAINAALHALSEKSSAVLQWIPSHCGIAGNEKADALAKAASQRDQSAHPVTYREAKSIIKNGFGARWKKNMKLEPGKDAIHLLERDGQTRLFRLRTGHCRLLSHLYKLKISHTNECPCGTGIQDAEHVLQDCPTHVEERNKIWPDGEELSKKLWGSREDLERTVSFIRNIDVDI